jgi:hypothetical protein
VNRVSDTQAFIGFSASEAGWAYYTVKDANTPAPTSIDVRNGVPIGAVTTWNSSKKVITLTAGAQDIYVVVQDAAGNLSAPLKIDAAAFSSGTTPGTGNPTAWTAVGNSKFGTSGINAIAYGDGKFVAGGSRMAYSPDGVNWTSVSNSTFERYEGIFATAYGSDKFVAVGGRGKMAYSTDGINWTTVADSTFGTTQISAIAWGGNKFVAGGLDSKMAYSYDGVTWTAIQPGTGAGTNTFVTDSITAIAYDDGTFVAGGYNNNSQIAYIATSSDGVTWTAVDTSSSIFDSNYVRAIAYGNGKFVAVSGGQGKIVYSSNGVNWTAVDTSNLFYDSYPPFGAIAYGNGWFVAVAAQWSGEMAYSSDGINWTAVSDRKLGAMWTIAYGNGTFVAGDSEGKIAYSSGE